MSLTIAVPTNSLHAPLCERAEDVCKQYGLKLLRGTEQQCADWLARHTAEVALISPLGYAVGSLQAEYRIIPAQALALEGLTYTGSVYVKHSAAALEKAASAHASDFLMMMGAAVISEKFDISLTLTQESQGMTAELLKRYDAVFDYGFDAEQQVVLDISDEWTDYTQSMLPLAFWTCRPDEVPESIDEVLVQMARENLLTEEKIFEHEHQGTTAARSGTIHWQWSEELEVSLQKTIEMLFYLQHVSAITDTKVWQRDPFVRL